MPTYAFKIRDKSDGTALVTVNGWGTGICYPSRQMAAKVVDILRAASYDNMAEPNRDRLMLEALGCDVQADDDSGQVVAYTDIYRTGYGKYQYGEPNETEEG